MTAIKQAAQALCKRRNTGQCAAICLSYSSLWTTPGSCPEAVTVWGADARAVIAAIREPTGPMNNAGYAEWARGNGAWSNYIWRAMIDAALANEPRIPAHDKSVPPQLGPA